MDKLELMFQKQIELQIKLNGYERIFSSPKMTQSFINQMILAAIEELIEIMRETPYKHPDFTDFGWKKGQQMNEENFKKEIADLMHFVLNLCIAAKMDANELFSLYIDKNSINKQRKQEGY
jgi:dimeric dUTPase (all-alpha-NTP-PPase superfamily)